MNRRLGVKTGDANVLTKNNLIHTKRACVHFSESGVCHLPHYYFFSIVLRHNQ